MSGRKIIETSDGSHSLLHEALNETYHSHHGAMQESLHVFIDAGLEYFNSTFSPDDITIFEMGFGTGLNVWLVAGWARRNQVRVAMTSVEAYPLENELITKLNYPRLLKDPVAKEEWVKIHQAVWQKPVNINKWFTLTKWETQLKEVEFSCNEYDIIFYDAFAPSKQPELWDIEVFRKLSTGMKRPSVLVTYCARGQFKRDLMALKMEVETLPGPPGKNEMVRASFKM